MSRPAGLSQTFKTSLNASRGFKPPSKTGAPPSQEHNDTQRQSVSGPPAKKPRLSASTSSNGSNSRKSASAAPRSHAPANGSKTEVTVSRVSGTGQHNLKAVYNVLYRTPSNKKNKPWEADGVLVHTNSNALILKNLESAKEVSRGSARASELSEGEIYSVGSKEAEISHAVSIDDYLSGALFLDSSSAAAALPAQASTSAITLDASTSKPFKDPVYGGSASTKSIANTAAKAHPRFDPLAKGAVVMQRPNPAHQRKLNAKGLPVVDVVVDPHISKHLRPHQIEGVKFMYDAVSGLTSFQEGNTSMTGQGAILADDMGLGKTIQAIALIWTLLRQSPYFGAGPLIKRALVVCPASLIHNWKKEFDKWLGPDKIKVCVLDGSKTTDPKVLCASAYHEVIVVGYERLRVDADVLAKASPPVGLIVCDEGHRLKTSETKTVHALAKLHTPRRVILSGTPIQNDLGEFHAVADWANPGLLGDYAKFKRTYEVPILRSREQYCTSENKVLGNNRNRELMKGEQLGRIANLFLLRRTQEVLQGYLPRKHEHVVFIQPTVVQRSMCKTIIDNHHRLQEQNALQTLMMLQKVSNSPGLIQRRLEKGKKSALLDGVSDLLEAEDASDPGLSGKLSVLLELLRILCDTTEEKVVIASNFTHTLDLVQEICQESRFSYCRLDGSTPVKERQKIVDSFNRESQSKQFIFLLSSKAGGTGLNIIGASRLVLLDSDWNPSVDLQAMARIHRDGQKRQVHLYRFLTAGSIDEKIFQRQITKNGLANALMDGSKGAPSESKTDAFTQAELKAILRTPEATRSETHDLLGCPCLSSDPLNTMDDGSDEDAELPPPSFSSAKHLTDEPSPQGKNKLKVLKQWRHIDGYNASTVDTLTDVCLFQIASRGAEQCKAVQSGGSMSSSHGMSSMMTQAMIRQSSETDLPLNNLSATISFVLSRQTDPTKSPAYHASGDGPVAKIEE